MIIELIGSNMVSSLIYLEYYIAMYILDLAFSDHATISWHPVMCNIITLPVDKHCRAYGLDWGIDDHTLIVGFRTFHSNETCKCGVFWTHWPLSQVSCICISFVQHKFYPRSPPPSIWRDLFSMDGISNKTSLLALYLKSTDYLG